MKKVLAMAGILCCLLFAFSACSSDTATESEVDQAVDTAQESMDQAQDAADEAMDSAGEMADEAMEENVD